MCYSIHASIFKVGFDVYHALVCVADPVYVRARVGVGVFG